MKQLIALAALPLMAAPAMAAPYVESKTTTGLSDGDWTATQTELRVGYEGDLGSGITGFAEIGPGIQWRNGDDTQGIGVAEVGVKAPLGGGFGVEAKVAGEYGEKTEVFDLGGELKVRYTF